MLLACKQGENIARLVSINEVSQPSSSWWVSNKNLIPQTSIKWFPVPRVPKWTAELLALASGCLMQIYSYSRSRFFQCFDTADGMLVCFHAPWSPFLPCSEGNVSSFSNKTLTKQHYKFWQYEEIINYYIKKREKELATFYRRFTA